MTHRITTRAALALALATTATAASASDLYWQGGAGGLNSANYTSVDTSTVPTTVTPDVAPASTDYVYIGAGGSATNAADLTLGRLRLGHNSTAAQPTAQPGDGSLLISAGTLSLGGTTTGGIDSGLLVGYNASGSLTITGGAVTAQFFGKVGYADAPGATGTGTVSVSNNGALTISNRGLSIGEGLPGSLTLSDTATLKINNNSNGGFTVGNTSTGAFTQTGGTTTVANNSFVGRNATVGSSMTITGGSYSAATLTVADGTAANTSAHVGGSATATISGAVNVANGSATDTSLLIDSSANFTATGSLNVGGGAGSQRAAVTITDSAVVSTGGIAVGSGNGATDASLTISGNAQVTGSAGFNVGSGASTTNATATIKGNAVVNLNNGMTVGLNADPNAVLNVADNATINLATGGSTTVHFFVGRGSSTTTLNMTGGTVTSPNYVLFGTASSSAANVTANHSGGTINAGTSATSPNRGFKLGDTNGTTTYNLSGSGAINVANGLMIVGRQASLATMNQTGGSVTANGGLHVGQAETATASSQTGTGTYNLSGGTLAATVPSGSTVDALAIAPAGTGTFHVTGDDASVTVTGNMSVNFLPAVDPTPARVGTLAYTLESGESLTEINVTGTATFAAGSVLSLDFNSLTPSQSSFNLLTAADIIDNGLSFTAPTGWNFQIVSGGNGEILQAFTMATAHHPGDTNNDGVVDLTDLNNVLNNFGSTGIGNPGDDNSDHVVDLTDLNAVLNNFGTVYTSLSAVPEPASLSLFTLGATSLIARRRHSR